MTKEESKAIIAEAITELCLCQIATTVRIKTASINRSVANTFGIIALCITQTARPRTVRKNRTTQRKGVANDRY